MKPIHHNLSLLKNCLSENDQYYEIYKLRNSKSFDNRDIRTSCNDRDGQEEIKQADSMLLNLVTSFLVSCSIPIIEHDWGARTIYI
jgi:hypothetical protein